MEIILFIFGLFFGSFFGVLVDRIPKDKEVVKGRSKCDFCKKELKWYDLVPLFSFVFLRGKCRYCQKKLSLFYPAIELLTGLLFAFVYIWFYSLGIVSFFYFLLVFCSLLITFFMDLKYGIIADKIIFPTSVISILYFAFFEKTLFLNHLLSGVGAFVFFFAVSFIFYSLTKKEGMGGGDIKLSFLLGVFLGFPSVLVCLYIAFLTATLASIILILWNKKRFQKDSIPFGPFLISGAYISALIGSQIYSLFLKLTGLG